MQTFDEIRETQRKTWNKFSPGWQKWDSFVMSWLRPIGDTMLDVCQLRERDKVLDIATGTGEPGLSAAKRVQSAEVTGVDLAEDMVGIAQQNAQKHGVTNYTARVADACRLPFEDNSFDAVICRHGIMFVPDVPTAMKELNRVLKSSGRLVVSSWGPPPKNDWATTALGIVNKMLSVPPPPADGPGLFRCSQDGALAAILNNSQFVQSRQMEVKGEISFNSAHHYWEFMTDVVAPVVAALAKSDSATQEAVKAAVINEVEKRRQNGAVKLNWQAWVACGVKQA